MAWDSHSPPQELPGLGGSPLPLAHSPVIRWGGERQPRPLAPLQKTSVGNNGALPLVVARVPLSHHPG